MRQLGEPICMFGEGPAERRNRLRELIGKLGEDAVRRRKTQVVSTFPPVSFFISNIVFKQRILECGLEKKKPFCRSVQEKEQCDVCYRIEISIVPCYFFCSSVVKIVCNALNGVGHGVGRLPH